MIELVAVAELPREDADLWEDGDYLKGVAKSLALEMAKNIMDRMTVRRIKDVGTKSIKIEARLLIYERESAVGGSMPITLADAIEEREEKARLVPKTKEVLKPGGPLIEIAVRKITMPDKREAGQ